MFRNFKLYESLIFKDLIYQSSGLLYLIKVIITNEVMLIYLSISKICLFPTRGRISDNKYITSRGGNKGINMMWNFQLKISIWGLVLMTFHPEKMDGSQLGRCTNPGSQGKDITPRPQNRSVITVCVWTYIHIYIYIYIYIYYKSWIVVWIWGEASAGISLRLLKSTKKTTGLTSSFSRWIAVNNTYAFTTKAWQRNLGFQLGISGTETSNWGSAPSSLLIPVRSRNKNSYPAGDENRHRCMWGSDSASAPQQQSSNNCIKHIRNSTFCVFLRWK